MLHKNTTGAKQCKKETKHHSHTKTQTNIKKTLKERTVKASSWKLFGIYFLLQIRKGHRSRFLSAGGGRKRLLQQECGIKGHTDWSYDEFVNIKSIMGGSKAKTLWHLSAAGSRRKSTTSSYWKDTNKYRSTKFEFLFLLVLSLLTEELKRATMNEMDL